MRFQQGGLRYGKLIGSQTLGTLRPKAKTKPQEEE
jgi:hypothetical protein